MNCVCWGDTVAEAMGSEEGEQWPQMGIGRGTRMEVKPDRGIWLAATVTVTVTVPVTAVGDMSLVSYRHRRISRRTTELNCRVLSTIVLRADSCNCQCGLSSANDQISLVTHALGQSVGQLQTHTR